MFMYPPDCFVLLVLGLVPCGLCIFVMSDMIDSMLRSGAAEIHRHDFSVQEMTNTIAIQAEMQ